MFVKKLWNTKSKNKDAQEVKAAFMQQPRIERAFRNIKSFPEVRSVYHWKHRRVKAHVLVCFLAYYLVKKAELEFRENDITREAVRVLRSTDKLKLTTYTLTANAYEKTEWHWLMGEIGCEIKKEISSVGWWKSIQGYKRSLLNQIAI